MSWLKRRLPQKRWKRVCLYILSIILILVAADMILVQCWRHVTIGYDTTRITEPLTPAGYPDYLAALNAELSKGVTPENNAAPLLIQILPASDVPAEWRKAVFDYFHLGPTAGAPEQAVVSYENWSGPGGAGEQKGVTPDELLKEDEQMRKSPWHAVEHPQWKKWLDANAPAMEMVHEAAKRRRYDVPLLGSHGKPASSMPGEVIAALLPALGPYRAAGNVLMSRAMMRLGEGDTPGFEQDVEDSLRLSRLVGQGSTLIELLVAVAIDTQAEQTIQRSAAGGVLERAAAERLTRWMAALPPLPSTARCIDVGERYMFLDAVCMVSEHGVQGLAQVSDETEEVGSSPGHSVGFSVGRYLVPIHCDAIMRMGNGYYDRLAAAASEPTYLRRKAAFEVIDRELAEFERGSVFKKMANFGKLLIGILAPALGRVQRNIAQGQEQGDLALAALALRVYRLDHGSYPETLAPLGLAADVTTDRFSDQPLIYRRVDKGYVLYSIGPDEKDDGGTERSATSGKNWDIVVRAAD